jgi:hypothetical protein
MKQTPILAHSAIDATATSAEIQVSGASIVMLDIEISGSGTWKVDIQGSRLLGGTYKDIYDNNGNQLTTGNITASRIQSFFIVSDFIKIVATEVANGATCTVNVIPVF